MPLPFTTLKSGGHHDQGGSRPTLWLPLLAIGILLFFSVGEMYRHTLALLAVIGLVEFVRNPRQTQGPWFRWYLAAFLCIWIPILISLLDAEFLGASLTVAARYLIYLFAGYFIVQRLNLAAHSDLILAGVLAVLSFWALDGMVQLAFGHNIFGREVFEQGRLTGMLPGVRLGIVLAIFSPLFLHALYRFGRRLPILWLLLIPYLTAILYGGSRVSWMLLVLGAILYGIFLRLIGTRIDRRKIIAGLVVTALICGVALAQSDWLRDRFTQLTGLVSGDYQAMNTAVSDRLPHWKAGYAMWEQNPVNGIGVRGFPDAYPRYSGGDERHRSQPHLFLLEVGAETGTVGLAGYLLFFIVILSALWKMARAGRYEAMPWGMTLMVAAFPLSASLSLYAHFMSALICYLAILFFGIAGDEEIRADPTDTRTDT
ncbi:O-antigen ligase family protein [Imhoffiella purpurea]|uniref:Membrane protein n=1 Tax=Imhoffiella purpurea TaxID=1249627 RepID=W9VBL9_9GAMM|nr:O-antigen ligase family protein [Imhoffiella purpurea]EXJ16809.1 membrane protein [Imhoffiella purpurea]